ncbi:hypothetical protein [Amaricoccus sp. W119]|uniref:hypothetical protein n=1 Tax=Amaricoccus sp. W119 TaxID=3391833 RepID=UPI0039A5CBE5
MAETPADPSQGTAAGYIDMLKEAERADSRYHQVCDDIDKLCSDLDTLAKGAADREFQIFWANLEVLKPTIYSRAPVPVVTSRFRDRKPLARRAADLLERALVSDFEADDLHDTITHARDDVATCARGAVWVRLGDRDGVDVPIAEHLDRRDFRHGAARKWREVPWAARRGWLSRKEFTERFRSVPPGVSFEERKIDGHKAGKKTGVWEIWDKEASKVVWVHESAKDVLDEKDPWLDLTGFFPCPRPAYGTLKRGTLTPVPDFVYYKDQIEEINELTARVSKLAEALRLRGIYPAGNNDVGEAVKAAFDSADDRALLIPVASLAALGTGSLDQSIVWLPIEQVANVITQCLQLRRQLIEDVYAITGISDIMRGSTDANETLGAQQLKSQYGNIRVRERQGEIARLARDLTRMKAEVMAENVSVPDLMRMAQVDDIPSQRDIQQRAAPLQQQAQAARMRAQKAMQGLLALPDQQAAQQQAQALQQQAQQEMAPVQAQLMELSQQVTQEAIGQFLSDQKTRPFVLDIETDSTIQPDENAEKQKRTEFMTALAPLLSQGVQAMQQAPQLGAFVAESIRFVASGFRAGRQMDDAIDELADQFKNYQPPPQQGGEDPQAAQMNAQAEMARAQAEGQKAQAEGARAQAEAQSAAAEIQIRQQETGAKVELTRAQIDKIRAEIQVMGAKTAAEVEAKAAEGARADQAAMIDADAREREFERSGEHHAQAEARADAESKAKVKAMGRPAE